MPDSAIDPNEFATLVPIKALSPEHCRDLAKQSEVCTFAKGEFIFKQGQRVEKIIYLTSGEVGLIMDGEPTTRVKGGSKLSKLPLEQGKRYTHTARALMDVTCIKVDPDDLDSMLAWEKSGGIAVQDIDESEDESDEDWMEKLLQANIFRRIPPGNIQSIFMKLETQHFKVGEAVFNQGEEGDRFYIVRQGQCKVIRKTRKNPEGMSLATLIAGDNFGEEALIADSKRNASVIFETKGVLMSLLKNDFLELLHAPLVNYVSFFDAQALATDGAIWVDVRLPAEFTENHIKGSINVPLPLLRVKMSMLGVDQKYLLYCDTGQRCSIASYLLSQEGFDCHALQGSLSDVPDAEKE